MQFKTSTKMTVKEQPRFFQVSLSKALYHLLFIAGVMYLCFLLKLAVASDASVCQTLRKLDSSHTCDPPNEGSHVADCRFCFKSVFTVIDRFVLAHLLGWLAKALLIPDRRVLWISSFGFELIEFVLSGYIPTFEECWWDSLVLDVLLCNFIGIEVGCRLMSYLSKSHSAFTLGFHCEHLWDRRLVQSERVLKTAVRAALVGFILLTDLNSFLLKEVFLVRSASPLNVYRLIWITLLSIPSLRQLSARTRRRRFDDNESLRFGFLYIATLACELVTVLFRSVNDT